MTVVNRQVTLGTAATEIVGADNMPHHVFISNNATPGGEEGATNFVFLGASGVTASTGAKLVPGQSVNLRMEPSDRLFAVSSPAGIVVSVLDVRQED